MRRACVTGSLNDCKGMGFCTVQTVHDLKVQSIPTRKGVGAVEKPQARYPMVGTKYLHRER